MKLKVNINSRLKTTDLISPFVNIDAYLTLSKKYSLRISLFYGRFFVSY